MQLFMLYNFADNTAVIRGGLHGRLGQKPPKTHIFHPARPFCALWTIEDTLCPLWKSVTPMQLFTLYNFASETAVLRGGRHGRLGPISPKSHGFQPARRFRDLSTIEDTLCPLWKSPSSV